MNEHGRISHRVNRFKAKSADNPGKVEKVLHEFKHGELHSGSKEGPTVTNPAQAKAIAMSESGQSKKAKKSSAPIEDMP